MRNPGPERVALLTNFVQPYRRPLFQAIAKRLNELRIFVSTPMEPNRPWLPNEQGLDVVHQKSFFITRPWRHPRGFSEDVYIHIPYDTLAQLWRYAPHVIISGQMGFQTLLSLFYRWLRPSTKLILLATVSEHSEQGRGWLRTWLRRWMLPGMDAVLANGESGARYLQRFGVTRERIFFTPYTMDNAPFLALPLERDSKQANRLLYSGQLVSRKGLQPFLAVLQRWCRQNPERNVEFWLLGEGVLRSELERMLLPSNLVLNFVGVVQYDQLPDIYAQCGILAFPTLADEWGVVVNEAMAAGMPVLGSLYSQAVEELVVNDETGWTYRPDQPEEMYEALDRAMKTQPERLDEMRRIARNRIAQLTPDFVAERVMEAISYTCSHYWK